jgi:hypothetical protein
MDRALRLLMAKGGRLAVVLASALCVLVGQVGGQIHLAANPHVVCVEHERIEDAHGDVSNARSSAKPEITAVASAAAGSHDACVMPLTPNSGAVVALSAPPPMPPAEVVFTDAPAPEGFPGRTGPPLLHVAPKLSPPIG